MLAKSVLTGGKNLGFVGKLLIGVSSQGSGVRHASAFKFVPETAPAELGETTKMNLCQAVTNALDITLSSDKSSGTHPFLEKNIYLMTLIYASQSFKHRLFKLTLIEYLNMISV